MGSEGFELLTVTTLMTTVITITTFTNVRHPAEREDTIVEVVCVCLCASQCLGSLTQIGHSSFSCLLLC